MNTNIQPPATLTVDGTEYPIEQFSDTIRRLVDIHTLWRSELQTERMAVAKTEAAIRALDAELAQNISAELKAQAPAEATEAA